MIDTEVIKERERCKAIVKHKIEVILYNRDKMYPNTKQGNKRKLLSIFQRLSEDIIFLMGNPEYKPHPKPPKE